MKKITFTLIALFVSCFMWQVDAQVTETTSPALPIVDNTTVSSTLTVVGNANIGDLDVVLDINHTWVSDMIITLESPAGTIVTIFDPPSCSGNDVVTNLDDEAPTTSSACYSGGSANPAYPDPSYQPFSPLSAFDGENTLGDWILSVSDGAGGDQGIINTWGITYTPFMGQPPAIACPADIMINTTGGQCTGTTNWNTPLALDAEDGPLTPTQTAGPMSGTPLAPGMYVVTYSVTDSDNNTSTCSFNITVSDMEAPIAVCQDISLDLDATGSVTITAADLDNGSTDNCGIVSFEFAPGAPVAGSLTTSFVSNNGSAGNMFDVVALNDITVNSFDVNNNSTTTVDYEIYFKAGTYVGSETTAGDWTLVGSALGVISAGNDAPTALGLSMGVNLTAGNTYAFYVADIGPGVHRYINGTTAGALFASDANLEIYEGAGKGGLFGAGGTFSPRNFSGNLVYEYFEPAFNGTFDCSMVGANALSIVLTDAAGNSSTCMATVTISDVTAPVITCIGEPANITDSTSSSPALPIPDNDPAGDTATMTVTDNFIITDLNVDLDISHTWVGDIVVTITAPTGESATIVDQMGVPTTGFGCSSNDLLITLDDEAALPIEDVCDAGPPAASGSYIPNNPLSVFDGVGTLGDWTITVIDLAGGDTGTLNSWGLSYGHDVSGSPLDVTLDANGMASVNMADLLLNVDEACGYTVQGGMPGTTSSLTTTFAGGNGQAGNMFDVKALNDLTIDSFDVSMDDGTTDDVEIYFKTGSWVGFDMDAAAWTLLATVPGVTSAGDNVPTPLNQTLGVDVTAGDTVAFYVTLTTTTAINYTNGTAVGALFASDANMEMYEGAGNAYPFASTFQPRNFNGNIVYTSGGYFNTLELDCSMLGENLVQVTVTDGSGNVATCMATVNVKDETAPVLVCATDPVTIELGPDGTATVDAMALLGFVDSTYTVLVIGSDNASNAAGFTDLTVPVTTAETVSFDWDYVLNDIPGFDSFGYLLNGVYTELIDPAVGNQTGNASIALAGGDVFGFRSQTSDNLFGNNETVISNFLPGFTGQFDPANWTETLTNSDGSATFVEIPGGPLSFDACGIASMGVSQTTVTCADIGTPLTITVFATDASGNPAACTATVTVVDALAPVVTCPADQTVDPGPGNLFYTVPDYIGTGEATAVDNCTDPVTITTQDPAPGSLISDGTYTVTITGEDASGNVATCSFTLTVESVLGIESNELSNAIAMFPNPAQEQITISNSSNIQLEKAVIYDLNGKMVNQINLSNMQGERVIDISALASGVYVVQLTSDKSSAVKRLIKE